MTTLKEAAEEALKFVSLKHGSPKNASDIEKMLEEALAIYKEPIPSGVYFRYGNFYNCESRMGAGIEFYNKWKDRASEFPGAPYDDAKDVVK